VRPTVSVVIPCHNEEGMLPSVFAVLGAWAGVPGSQTELVFVENGSSDATLGLLTAFRDVSCVPVQVLSLPVGDYGSAVRAGLEAATGWAVAVLDCDMVDTGFVETSCASLAADPALGAVLASKRVAGSRDDRSAYRRAGTRVFSGLVRAVTGSSLADTHGNKTLRAAAARPVLGAVTSIGALFDTELLVRMERAGSTFSEVPATVVDARPPRSSYLSRVPATLVGLVRLRARLRRGSRQVR